MYKLQLALIGVGYWGKVLLQKLILHPSVDSIWVYDVNESVLNAIENASNKVIRCASAAEAIEQPQVQAALIATPTATHYTLAKQALQHNKHVFIEKPFVTSVEQGQELISLANTKQRVLMVDHVFMYNPAIWLLKDLLQQPDTGHVSYINSTRVNLGIYQDDVSVLWDLACHDVSIVNFLMTEYPDAVRAVGKVHKKSGFEDLVYLFLYYPSGTLVHIHTSWASPVKIRQMQIGTDKKMITYDDIQPSNKVAVYHYDEVSNKRDRPSKLIDYRLGDIVIPKYEPSEPLQNAISDFVLAIQTGKQPLSNAENALAVTRILQAADESLQANGALITLI